MATYAGAESWNENTKKDAKTLAKLEKSKAKMEGAFYSTGTKAVTKKEVDAEEHARNKLLNFNETEQEYLKQRILNEYPKDTEDGEGRKSKNTQGYGKEPIIKNAKGGVISSASKRADGCAVRGKTKGRMV